MYELIGGIKSLLIFSPRFRENAECVIRSLDAFIRFEKCMRDKLLNAGETTCLDECFEIYPEIRKHMENIRF